MCDSISVMGFIDAGLSNEEYEECRFPTRANNGELRASSDFRVEYGTSLHTGAQFRVTPLGELMEVASGKRLQHGRVVAYLFEGNIPANVIGNNRLLVNGVWRATKLGLLLLKTWLAQNGCTKKGLKRIRLENVQIVDLTLTFLYRFKTEAEAYKALYDFRTYTEAILNRSTNAASGHVDAAESGEPRGSKRRVAFSIPGGPVKPDSVESYTSYVKQREFMLSAYIKDREPPENAFLLPIEDEVLNEKLIRQSTRTLRVEVRVYGKWLKAQGLHLPENWKGNREAYEQVFGLLRTTLRLDEGLRTRRLKHSTIDDLKLNDRDKAYLHGHLDGKVVREHADFSEIDKTRASKRYSKLRDRIFELTDGIDLNIPYDVQSRLASTVGALLVFPGEFEPDQELAGYVFSRLSVPVAVKQIEGALSELLESTTAVAFKREQYTIYRGPERAPARLKGGIANAPLLPVLED